ncbi:COG1470 family protein [Rubinisphaera margarita]|uniref:COG1470 family protein n=1 Tax=Rubinisphaera margarita TaxID=2909586 RepID=UPI001EE7F0DE|nr:DUF11 domain-containing protein [Rubinisphaera margarita]MCG6157932.1 DUF11 domain-containing protein [Rubinisphaera margarita]
MYGRFSFAIALLLGWQVADSGQQAAAQRQSDDRSQSEMRLQNNGGEDVLSVTRIVDDRIRAKDTFEYRIKVQNVSSAPVHGIVVHEKSGNGLQIKQVTGSQEGSQSARKRNQSNSQASSQNKSSQQSGSQQSGNQNQSAQNQSGNSDQNANNPSQKNLTGAEQGQAAREKQSGSQPMRAQNPSANIQSPTRYDFTIGVLEPGQSETITVAATAPKAGNVQSCLWVDFNSGSAMCSSFEVVDPELELTADLKVDRNLHYEPCQEVSGFYTCDTIELVVSTRNPGEGPTKPAKIDIQLPQGLSMSAKNQSRSQTVNVGPIESGQTVKRTMQLHVHDPQALKQDSQITVKATAGELKARTSDGLKLKVLQPQLKVAVQQPGTHYANSRAQYKIDVSNPSDAPVMDTRLIINVPSEVAEMSINNGELQEGQLIEIGCLKAGETRSYTVEMLVHNPMEGLTVQAKADGYCVKAVEKEVTTNVEGVPAIRLEAVDKVDPVPVGDETVYEVSVKNQGTAKDTNISLTGTLPRSMEFVEGRGASKVSFNNGQLNFGKIKTLAPGDQVTWYIRAKANSDDQVQFSLELTSDATSQPVREEEPTNLFSSSTRPNN